MMSFAYVNSSQGADASHSQFNMNNLPSQSVMLLLFGGDCCHCFIYVRKQASCT